MNNLGPLNPFIQPAGPPVGYFGNVYLTLQSDGYATTALTINAATQYSVAFRSDGYATTSATFDIIDKSIAFTLPFVVEGLLSSEHDSDGYAITFPNVEYGTLYSPHQTAARQFFGRLSGSINFNRNINVHALETNVKGSLSSEHIANTYDNLSNYHGLVNNTKLANINNDFTKVNGIVNSEHLASKQEEFNTVGGSLYSEHIANTQNNYVNIGGFVNSEHIGDNKIQDDSKKGALYSEHLAKKFNVENIKSGSLTSEHNAYDFNVINNVKGSVVSEFEANTLSFLNNNNGTICSEHIGNMPGIFPRLSGILTPLEIPGESYEVGTVIEGSIMSEHDGEVYTLPDVIEGEFRPRPKPLTLMADGYATTSLTLKIAGVYKLTLRSDGYATTSLILTPQELILLESTIDIKLDILGELSQTYPIDRPKVDIDKMGKPLINGLLPPGVYQQWTNNKNKNTSNK